jgi:hypothetical protein
MRNRWGLRRCGPHAANSIFWAEQGLNRGFSGTVPANATEHVDPVPEIHVAVTAVEAELKASVRVIRPGVSVRFIPAACRLLRLSLRTTHLSLSTLRVVERFNYGR